MQKYIAIILSIILSLSFTLTAFASDSMGGGGSSFSFDYETEEFEFTYDNFVYHHNSDGTCYVSRVGSSDKKLINKNITNLCFRNMGLKFTSDGVAYIDTSEQAFYEKIASSLSCLLGLASPSAGAVTDFICATSSSDNVHSFYYDYMTDNLKNLSVSDDGSISISSDKLSDIYDILLAQYLASINAEQYDINMNHDGSINAFCEGLNGWGTNPYIPKDTTFAYYKNICNYLIDNGYDILLRDNACRVIGINSSMFKYFCYNGGYYFYDSDCTKVSSCVAVVNLQQIWADYDTSQDVADYVSYQDFLGFYTVWGYCGKSLYCFKNMQAMYDFAEGNVGKDTYFTTDFINKKLPDGITLDTTQLSADWATYNEEIIKAIQEATEGITDETERQAKIDEVFEKYLKKINDNLGDINDTIESSSKKTNSILRDILDEIKDFNKDYNNFIKDLEKDFLKDFKKYLKDISDSVKDIAKDVGSIKTLTAFNTFLELVDTDDSAKNELNNGISQLSGKFSIIADLAKTKFPFCTPWDIHYVLRLFVAEPRAPVFVWEFRINSLDYSHDVTIDLSVFNDYLEPIYSLECIVFLWGLIMLTRKMFIDGKGDIEL